MENAPAVGNGTHQKEPKMIKTGQIKLRMKDQTGTVRFFNNKRGWGFIIQDGEQEDAFVHYSWIVSNKRFKKLNDDDFVIFDLYEVMDYDPDDNKSRWQARNVRIINDTII